MLRRSGFAFNSVHCGIGIIEKTENYTPLFIAFHRCQADTEEAGMKRETTSGWYHCRNQLSVLLFYLYCVALNFRGNIKSTWARRIRYWNTTYIYSTYTACLINWYVENLYSYSYTNITSKMQTIQYQLYYIWRLSSAVMADINYEYYNAEGFNWDSVI